MALTCRLVLLLGAATLPLLLCLTAEAREVGVNYGRVANDLPDPAAVVQLLRENGITMVRIYDTNDAVLRSFANTGIKLMLMLPNENLADAARSPSYAADWARRSVAAYLPATRIHAVSVGNEVFDSRPDLTPLLVPAMTNVQAALAQLGLADAIMVSTPLSFAARTGSYLTINLYPYLATDVELAMTGAELPMATDVELAMAAGAELAGAVCVGAELAMATGAELARSRADLAVAARSKLAPPPWLELE
ncbi:unnamed protein product [Miscanthus lutarioriparius]|uniref:Glucan endo-1,3-beta-D-glucosidase n=1 Tax=Miscanthus lutarioriparius TaxID=422564 RepID=A0A811MXZ0_9POAL|nr:unnamed protein product [Miscanthus lutarioriparius]